MQSNNWNQKWFRNSKTSNSNFHHFNVLRNQRNPPKMNQNNNFIESILPVWTWASLLARRVVEEVAILKILRNFHFLIYILCLSHFSRQFFSHSRKRNQKSFFFWWFLLKNKFFLNFLFIFYYVEIFCVFLLFIFLFVPVFFIIFTCFWSFFFFFRRVEEKIFWLTFFFNFLQINSLQFLIHCIELTIRRHLTLTPYN